MNVGCMCNVKLWMLQSVCTFVIVCFQCSGYCGAPLSSEQGWISTLYNSTPYPIPQLFQYKETEEERIQAHSVNTIIGIKSIFLMSISTPELERTHFASEICKGWRLQLLVDAVLIERKAKGDLSKVNATWFIGSKFNLAGSHCSAVCLCTT